MVAARTEGTFTAFCLFEGSCNADCFNIMNPRPILIALCCAIVITTTLSQPTTAEKKKEPSFYFSSLDIHTMVKESKRVFYGEVVRLNYVQRENTRIGITTDVTVRIIANIRGRPNTGPDRITFMICGGIEGNTATYIVGAPEFKVGEKVFMFLKQHPRLGQINPFTGRRIRIPYDGLVVGPDGKVEVKDKTVKMPYSYKVPRLINGRQIEMESIAFMDLPINLVVKIARASLIDTEAIKRVDDQLRTLSKQTPDGVPTRQPARATLNTIEARVDAIIARNAQQNRK